MKPLFKNKTKYTEELYLKYCNIHTKTTFFSSSFYTLLMCLLFILFISVQIKLYNYAIVFIFCIILSIYILWKILYPFYLSKKEISSDKIAKEEVFTFKFYDKYFSIEKNNTISKNSYKDLIKTLITDEYCYLYISKRYSFILDNKCFFIGDVLNFKNFIHKKTSFTCKFKDISTFKKTH